MGRQAATSARRLSSSHAAGRPASSSLKQFRDEWRKKRSARNRFLVVAFPALRTEMLLGHEAHFIIHLRRAVDPVAEIDVGQTHCPGTGDMIEDHEGAERAVF